MHNAWSDEYMYIQMQDILILGLLLHEAVFTCCKITEEPQYNEGPGK